MILLQRRILRSPEVRAPRREAVVLEGGAVLPDAADVRLRLGQPAAPVQIRYHRRGTRHAGPGHGAGRGQMWRGKGNTQ